MVPPSPCRALRSPCLPVGKRWPYQRLRRQQICITPPPPVPGHRRHPPCLSSLRKKGATPVICLQHFAGPMNNSDPIHTNRLAQDRPVILVDYRGVGRSVGQTPDSVPGLASDIIAFIRALRVSTHRSWFGASSSSAPGLPAEKGCRSTRLRSPRSSPARTPPAKNGGKSCSSHPAPRARSTQGLARTHHRAANRSRAEPDAPGHPGRIRCDHAIGQDPERPLRGPQKNHAAHARR